MCCRKSCKSSSKKTELAISQCNGNVWLIWSQLFDILYCLPCHSLESNIKETEQALFLQKNVAVHHVKAEYMLVPLWHSLINWSSKTAQLKWQLLSDPALVQVYGSTAFICINHCDADSTLGQKNTCTSWHFREGAGKWGRGTISKRVQFMTASIAQTVQDVGSWMM